VAWIAAGSLAFLSSIGALLFVLWQLIEGVRAISASLEDLQESARSPDAAGLEHRLAALELKVEGLPSIWERYAEETRKAAERARFHARRAAERAEDIDDGGVGGVPIDDGRAGEGGGVPPVPVGVAAQAEPGFDLHRAAWQRKLMLP
jgi:hypothetical protein